MFGGNYAFGVKLIEKMYENDIDEIDRAHASVLFECIEKRDSTSQCNSLSYEEANLQSRDILSCLYSYNLSALFAVRFLYEINIYYIILYYIILYYIKLYYTILYYIITLH